MSHKKFGPDRFSRFDVYWIHTNKHPDTQTDRQAKFIYRRGHVKPLFAVNQTFIFKKYNIKNIFLKKTCWLLNLYNIWIKMAKVRINITSDHQFAEVSIINIFVVFKNYVFQHPSSLHRISIRCINTVYSLRRRYIYY